MHVESSGRGKLFLIIRLLLLCTNAVYLGYEYFLDDSLGLNKKWVPKESVIIYLGVMFVFSVLATGFVIKKQINSDKKYVNRPSWFRNPFNFYQPIQVFHMAAWVIMVNGAIHLLATYLNHKIVNSQGLMMFVVGVGIRIGISISAQKKGTD